MQGPDEIVFEIEWYSYNDRESCITILVQLLWPFGLYFDWFFDMFPLSEGIADRLESVEGYSD